MPAQSHESDPRILGRRTLQRDHRCLATLLRPDIAVLDIGCGTGAITSGIARAVGTQGHVVGVDRDAGLSELARREHGTLTNLHFENGDATNLNFRSQFDIVTAARTLQWIAEPRLAVANMKKAHHAPTLGRSPNAPSSECSSATVVRPGMATTEILSVPICLYCRRLLRKIELIAACLATRKFSPVPRALTVTWPGSESN